jgi:septum formation protein
LAAASELDITDAKQRAREMLLNQRGKEITVLTGMHAFRGRNMSSKIEECVETTVFMREYTDKEIDEYIETFEPIDKAGAFGIQGKGISLMEAIRGDYYNVVGLPLVALKRILEHNNFNDLYFDFYTSTTLRVQEHSLPVKPHEFAVLSIGDINYDFVYNNLPDNFIDIINIDNSIKIQGPIDRKAGGTAVQFAKGAKKAGFKNIYIAGVYGNDVLGQEIEKELRREKFEPLLGAKYKQEKTSIAIIIRQTGQKDFSITITDSIQSLPPASREDLAPYIGKSDVIYCSGYCITDNNRRYSIEQILSLSRNSKKIVILDVVKNMDTKIKFSELKDQILRVKNVLYGFTENSIDIVVSEFREIFRWLGVDEDQKDEITIFEKNREFIINELKPFFSLVILRTSDYSKEVIIQLNSDTKIRTNNLDYPKTSNERLGYSDMLTAKYIHNFLSPRVILASKSPQRITLLKQIMADTKIIVHPSNVDEGEVIKDEDIVKRVTRLAMKKAEQSLSNNTIPTIEFVIGADTEIGLRDNNGGWDVIPHPKTDEEAYECIKKLSGTTHSAVTGIAIIYRDEKSKEIKKIVDSMETRVEFFELDDDTIKTYISSKEPINRAGGYAIQGKGAMLVKRIEGSYSNVVGLPLELLISMGFVA